MCVCCWDSKSCTTFFSFPLKLPPYIPCKFPSSLLHISVEPLSLYPHLSPAQLPNLHYRGKQQKLYPFPSLLQSKSPLGRKATKGEDQERKREQGRIKMERTRFVIEAAEVESMSKESRLSVLQLLPCLVKSAQKLARPPISKYPVGAVGLGSNGRIFLGANLEFPGLPLHHSIHAEQFLVTNAAIHGETQLKYIAVSSAPCGHCRQFLQEIRGAPEIKILVTSTENGGGDHKEEDEDEALSFRLLTTYLPHRFGPDDLLDKDVPLLLEPHHNAVVSIDAAADDHHENNVMNGDVISNGDVADHHNDLKCAALEAANQSHAPYSGCSSGVALMDAEGKIYKGSYTESAAYNPSLGPVQAALVAFVAAGGGGGYDRIVAGALVEKEGAVVVQAGTARLLLQSISPRCDFRVFQCRAPSSYNCKKPST